MKALLDTHTLLWMADDSPELSQAARAALLPSTAEKYYSVVSLWEISIKVGLGKLPLRQPLENFLRVLEGNPHLVPLALVRDHFVRYAALPFLSPRSFRPDAHRPSSERESHGGGQ